MEYIFIYFNVLNSNFTGADYEINCSYIRSYLKMKGINTMQAIFRGENSNLNPACFVEYILSIIEDSNIVVYINEYNYYVSKVYISELKNRIGNRFICIGPSTQYIAESLHKDINFDIYIYGEPYYILENLTAHDNAIQIYFNIIESGALISNQYLKDIDYNKIPHPYSNYTVPAEEIFNVGMYSSRGCIGNCCFCSYSYQNEINEFSINSVIEELKFIKNEIQNYDGEIMFLDDCFSSSEQRIIEICRGIQSNDINYRFWCSTRTDVLSILALDELKKANFTVVVGLETPSTALLLKTGKLLDLEADSFIDSVLKQYKYAESIKLNFVVTYMFLLPEETLLDINNSFEFLEMNNINNVSFNFMTLFPNSRLFNKYKSLNFLLKSPTGLPFRTLAANYDARILWKKLFEDKRYKRQFNMISNFQNLYSDFIEHYTGINSIYTLKTSRFVKSIDIDNINDNLVKWLKYNIDADISIFLNVNSITKTDSKLYCDDRKSLKISIREYDDLINYLYNNNIYVEKLSLVMNDIDSSIKIKLGEYYEQKLNKKTLLNIKDVDFEEKIIESYTKFKEKTSFSVRDFDILTFRNACALTNKCTVNSSRRYSVKNNELFLCDTYKIRELNNINDSYMDECYDCKFINYCSKCFILDIEDRKKICNLRRKCTDIYKLINTACFIIKNYIDMDTKLYVYSSINAKDTYISNNISEELFFIFDKHRCIIYNANKRYNFTVDFGEKQYLYNMFLKQTMLSNNICLDDKIHKFSLLK